MRQNLQREESLPRDFFYFELNFQRVKGKSSNSCRELCRLFQLSLSRWIFSAFNNHSSFLWFLHLCSSFCKEPQFITWPPHSSRWHFLESSSEVLPLWFFLHHRVLLCHGLKWDHEAWLPFKSEYSSSAIEAGIRSRGRRQGGLCGIAKPFSGFAAKIRWTLENLAALNSSLTWVELNKMFQLGEKRNVLSLWEKGHYMLLVILFILICSYWNIQKKLI